jgi:hypothetical protein
MRAGDVDPSYGMLKYVSDRFELNTEQRFWVAFLYATCYCGPTTFYIYNEFPDFENIDINRMKVWWGKAKSKLYFQTDKRWIRSRNQWVDVCASYQQKIGKRKQSDVFSGFEGKNAFDSYENAWRSMSGIYQFGRFAMFLYLEAVHVVTGFNMKPKTMDIAEAESCRNGLAFALNRTDLLKKTLNKEESCFLQKSFDDLVLDLETENEKNNVWNIETTLCAYKKYRLGKRWIGYYLDRQHDEIKIMEQNVKEGVDWKVLWDFRKETIHKNFLKES